MTFARAVTAKVPDARFGAPDCAGHTSWLVAFAANYAAEKNLPPVVALTHHHYHGGPPSNPDMTITSILTGAANTKSVLGQLADCKSAVAKLPLPYRMTEGNTCFGGGKPGVSDVFAASLWSADYLLYLAANGYAGVNLHGGDGTMVANSLGGHLSGDKLVTDKLTHPRPYYTPIADIDGTYTAEPVFYGMLFAQQFAGATLLGCAFDAAFTRAAFHRRRSGRRLRLRRHPSRRQDHRRHHQPRPGQRPRPPPTGMSVSSVLRLAASRTRRPRRHLRPRRRHSYGQVEAQPESAMIAYGHNAPSASPAPAPSCSSPTRTYPILTLSEVERDESQYLYLFLG